MKSTVVLYGRRCLWGQRDQIPIFFGRLVNPNSIRLVCLFHRIFPAKIFTFLRLWSSYIAFQVCIAKDCKNLIKITLSKVHSGQFQGAGVNLTLQISDITKSYIFKSGVQPSSSGTFHIFLGKFIYFFSFIRFLALIF